MKGKCVKWLGEKHYGFLAVDSMDSQVFVHAADLENLFSLKLGDKVTFEIQDTPKGKRAVKVKLITE